MEALSRREVASSGAPWMPVRLSPWRALKITASLETSCCVASPAATDAEDVTCPTGRLAAVTNCLHELGMFKRPLSRPFSVSNKAQDGRQTYMRWLNLWRILGDFDFDLIGLAGLAKGKMPEISLSLAMSSSSEGKSLALVFSW